MRFDVTDAQGTVHTMDTDKFESKFLNIDCMEVLKKMPDKCVDLCIVDPPYGIGENGNKNKSRGKLAIAKEYKPFAGLDIEPPNECYFAELLRVSKNQIVFGANHFISRLPIDSSCWIVWDKVTGKSDFADSELAWTSFKSAVRNFRFQWSGMLQGDMKNKENRIHPTQKPIALYKWLLSNYAKPGDKILDTHVGSASSLIACHQMGYKYWGFELDTDYYNSATERLNNIKAQISIMELV
jgi:site-specific DNA-methyltransferase (adenine-specific)